MQAAAQTNRIEINITTLFAVTMLQQSMSHRLICHDGEP